MKQYDSYHRQTYAQNFIKNPSLVRHVLTKIDIPRNALVVEVGSGEGIITRELAKNHSVIAIEKDRMLADSLRQDLPQVTVLIGDVLDIDFPNQDFWLVSNPPFRIFSRLIKKMIYGSDTLQGFLIFGQREAIERIIGVGYESTLSVMIKSLFQLNIVHYCKPTDFSPVPGVDVNVLQGLRIPARVWQSKREYLAFLRQGFEGKKSHVGRNLSPFFTYDQWRRLAGAYGIDPKAQPGTLTVEQWKGLYSYYRNNSKS